MIYRQQIKSRPWRYGDYGGSISFSETGSGFGKRANSLSRHRLSLSSNRVPTPRSENVQGPARGASNRPGRGALSLAP